MLKLSELLKDVQWKHYPQISEEDYYDFEKSQEYYKLTKNLIVNGTVVMFKDGKILCTGETNCNFGYCECCSDYEDKDIVKYAYLFEDDISMTDYAG